MTGRGDNRGGSAERPRGSAIRTIALVTLMTLLTWTVAGLLSEQPLSSSLPLIVLQGLLAALCAWALSVRLGSEQLGPNVIGILALHCLMYYGVANIMPALFADRRPPELELIIRIPASSTSYYALGTLGAVMFLVGAVGGAALPFTVLTRRAMSRPSRTRPWQWLPDYAVSIVSCIVLLAVVLVATAEFGIRFDATMLAEGMTATFTPFQLVLWGGIFYFLPVAPLLAASAVVQSRNVRQRRSATALLVLAILISLIVLMVWRMRSTAMIAVLLPIALLVHAGVLSLRRTLLPGFVAMILIYVTVTFIRLSQVATVLAGDTGGSVSLSDVASAMSENQGGGVLDRAMFDLSYRAAGLEGVAAILHAQDRQQVRLLMGESTVAGFAQALPGPLRGQVGIPERIKTAPSYLGIFGESDWVTTFLAELTLDFGPLALVGPAVLVGFLFGLADCLLFLIGNSSPALQGVLILRIPWLLTFLLMGSSAADLLAFFFKANIGYTILLVIVSGLVTAWARPGARSPLLHGRLRES